MNEFQNGNMQPDMDCPDNVFDILKMARICHLQGQYEKAA